MITYNGVNFPASSINWSVAFVGADGSTLSESPNTPISSSIQMNLVGNINLVEAIVNEQNYYANFANGYGAPIDGMTYLVDFAAGNITLQSAPTPTTNSTLSEWLPMPPNEGPPLPQKFQVYWPWYKPSPTPGASGFGITLYDQSGKVIVSSEIESLPISSVVEGGIVNAVISVTNTSTKVGQATPVTLTIKFQVTTPNSTIVSQQSQQFALAASQAMQIDSSKWSVLSFTVPVGDGGTTGTVTATLLDPSGNVLQTATANFGISSAPIIYGGTISFT